MLELDKLYNGDCLELMNDIPDGTVDAVICDLPYGVLHRNNPNSGWDKCLPLDELWKHWLRIAKYNAPFILFGQGMFTAELMMSQPKLWKMNLIWQKNLATGFLNANRMPMRCHEDIVIFYRKQPVYNPQMEYKGYPSHPRGNGKHREGNRCYEKYHNGNIYDSAHIKRVEPTADPNMRFPRSVLKFGKDRGKIILHPTQKPVNLLRWLIRTWSNEGDLILDCCAGSGSTLVAAIQEHRHFIGIEKKQEYYKLASSWVEKESSQLSIF